MTDASPPSNLPAPRPPTDPDEQHEATLRELGLQSKPTVPPGRIGELTDRLMVYASFDTGHQLLNLLPQETSGLVLCGAKRLAGIRKIRNSNYSGALLADPMGYAEAAATVEEPFVLPQGDGLFGVSLSDVLQGQRDVCATAVMTPTGYFRAGESAPLKAAAQMIGQIEADDVIFSVPIDVAWLTNEHFGQLLAVLSRVTAPKAVFLGGQFDPVGRYKAVPANLRRLMTEAGHVALFRTDLAAFDAMSHGAFAAAIGTGGSLRHVIPVGQAPRSSSREPDHSPSVLHPGMMAFHKGSLLAERFANAERRPACWCAACNGRGLDTFIAREDKHKAHAHGVHIWNAWAREMLNQRTLSERAEWWQERCIAAIAECDSINAQIEQPEAFEPSGPLKAWASLPTWTTSPSPNQARTP